MKKVVIISGVQIINNPRVVKEASALSQAGYDVEVIDAVYDAESKVRIDRILSKVKWSHIPVIDMSKAQLSTKFLFFVFRLRRKLSVLYNKWTNIEGIYQLGYFVKSLYQISKSRHADLYIVHAEQALWVGGRLLADGCKVAVDIEDWYSEDGLPQDRSLRPVRMMKRYEKILLQNAVYSTTTSNALSNALAKAYDCPSPAVVYNSFPLEERRVIDRKYIDRSDLKTPSITWFSQTIGPGRGLEQLIEALSMVSQPFQLHVRGNPRQGYLELLMNNVPKLVSENIYFHPQVPQDELLSRLCEHDIGFCGELSDCVNRNLTITNKVLEYLRAGLAIVASDTAGHEEVQRHIPLGVRIYKQKDTSSLAEVLESLLTDATLLRNAKKASADGMSSTFDWNKSSTLLVGLVEKSIGKP